MTYVSLLTQDLLTKARELFHVPAECTPQLYVACQSSVGTANSEQRGAILLPDALPFLRDRELLTLRWAPTDSSRREANARVQWDPKLPAQEPIGTPRPGTMPIWRGPQARAAHAARVLERERNQATEEWTDQLRKPLRSDAAVFNKARMESREPMSPPPSSPTASPEQAVPELSRAEVPLSPTPHRSANATLKPLVWKNQEEPLTPPRGSASPALSDTPPSLSGFGAWCARLNPFSRNTPQKEPEAPAPAAPVRGPTKTETRSFYAPKVRAKPMLVPDVAHVQGPAAYDIITQVLAAIREHPCAMHFRAPMSDELRKFSERRGRVTDLAAMGARAAKRDYGGVPLTRFAEELAQYLDHLVLFYGEHSTQAHAATGLGKFAETLLKELSKKPVRRDSDDKKKESLSVPTKPSPSKPAVVQLEGKEVSKPPSSKDASRRMEVKADNATLPAADREPKAKPASATPPTSHVPLASGETSKADAAPAKRAPKRIAAPTEQPVAKRTRRSTRV